MAAARAGDGRILASLGGGSSLKGSLVTGGGRGRVGGAEPRLTSCGVDDFVAACKCIRPHSEWLLYVYKKVATFLAQRHGIRGACNSVEMYSMLQGHVPHPQQRCIVALPAAAAGSRCLA